MGGYNEAIADVVTCETDPLRLITSGYLTDIGTTSQFNVSKETV